MNQETRTACLTALWILHGDALAELLRSHGEDGHAENLDSALQMVSRILGEEMGPVIWREAMDWASDRIWTGGRASAAPSRH